MNRYLYLILISLIFWACNNPKNNNTNNNITNDTTELISNLENKIRENPREHSLFYQRAKLRFQNQDYLEAINDMEIALRLDSTNAEYMNTIGDYYLRVGNSEKTKNILLKCTELYPENAEANLQLAQLYFYVEDYKSALAYIDKLEKFKKHSADSYFVKGLIYNEQDLKYNAVKCFRKVLEFDDKYWQAYNYLCLLYHEKKDTLALEYCSTATNLFPDNEEIRLNAAIITQSFNKLPESVSHYEYLLDKNPNSFQANFNLGYIYLVYSEDYAKAIEHYDKALIINNKSVKAYCNRGLAFEYSGFYKEAELDYRTALKLHPNYENAIQGLNSLDKKRKK